MQRFVFKCLRPSSAKVYETLVPCVSVVSVDLHCLLYVYTLVCIMVMSIHEVFCNMICMSIDNFIPWNILKWWVRQFVILSVSDCTYLKLGMSWFRELGSLTLSSLVYYRHNSITMSTTKNFDTSFPSEQKRHHQNGLRFTGDIGK